jgi:hypothetical protein
LEGLNFTVQVAPEDRGAADLMDTRTP